MSDGDFQRNVMNNIQVVEIPVKEYEKYYYLFNLTSSLIDIYPNDADLGRAVRDVYRNNKF